MTTDDLAALLHENAPLGAQNVTDWRPTATRLRAAGVTVGLDVERLAEALHTVQHPDHPLAGPEGDWCRDDVMEDAAAIARTYAATPAQPDRLREAAGEKHVIDVDDWIPQHLPFCAMRDEDECLCGVGPEYERMLASAYAATPAQPEPEGEEALPASDTSGLALVLEWRAFSDRFMDSDYRNDPNANHIRDAFAAGWDAAIARAYAATPEENR